LVHLFKGGGFQRRSLGRPSQRAKSPIHQSVFWRGIGLRQQVVGNLFQVKKVPSWMTEQNSSQKGAGGTFLNQFLPFSVRSTQQKHHQGLQGVSPLFATLFCVRISVKP